MKDYWFGEWVSYENDIEKQEAKIYLNLWKKFILKKLKNLELIEEQWIDRDESYKLSITTLGLKLQMQGEKSDTFDINQDGKYINPIAIGEL